MASAPSNIPIAEIKCYVLKIASVHVAIKSASLQIQRSALLDDETLRVGDFKSVGVFIKGFYHIRVTACI